MHSEQWLPARSGGTKQKGAVALGGCPTRCRKQVGHARLLRRANQMVDKVPSRLSSTLEMVDGLNKTPLGLSSTLEMVGGLYQDATRTFIYT